MVEDNINASFMRPWADEVCRLWRKILDKLEKGAPDSVSSTLDWAIKYTLYLDQIKQADLNMKFVKDCTKFLGFVRSALDGAGYEHGLITSEKRL